jgi:hypothetical protein
MKLESELVVIIHIQNPTQTLSQEILCLLLKAVSCIHNVLTLKVKRLELISCF